MWPRARPAALALARLLRSPVARSATRAFQPIRPNFFSINSKRTWASFSSGHTGSDENARGRRFLFATSPQSNRAPIQPALFEVLPRALYTIDYSTIYTPPSEKVDAWIRTSHERELKMAEQSARMERTRVASLQERVDKLFGAEPKDVTVAHRREMDEETVAGSNTDALLAQAKRRIADLEAQLLEERRKASLYAEAMHMAQTRAREQTM